LVVGRRLYDGGRVVQESPSLRGLATAPLLLVAAADAQRLGATNGESVKVTSGRGSVTVAIRAAKGVAPGTAVLAASAGGFGAVELIDAAEIVTDLRVETLR
jgi:anaerobic selenocysteine-containing dehydrogenase